jgi:2-succinyl-5-enolpyruvyl-6-hydroxy-3-cyclohexene-1-carboxylate synthase
MNGMKLTPKCDSTTRLSDLEPSNLVNLWAMLVAEELIRLGVNLVCIAPGSRSTPLVAAFAKRPELKKVVCQDERSAGFFALGAARATKNPAVVVVTSGSAVANLLPSVVEASNDHVPVLVFTADRPPELRNVGANQTIDQTKIFGNYVRSFVDVPVPDAKVPLRYLLSTVDQAFRMSTGRSPGPVHLNFMIREPFDIDAGEEWDRSLLDPLERWRESAAPLTSLVTTEAVAGIMDCAESGIIVAGAIRDADTETALLQLAERMKWPIVADVLSNLRFVKSDSVAHFADLALLDENLASQAPDVVLQFGGRLVSKRLQHYLDKRESRAHILVSDGEERLDPACVATHLVTTNVKTLIDELISSPLEKGGRGDFGEKTWLENSKLVEQTLLELKVDESLTEISVARSLLAKLNSEHFLFCASSMPIRDLNMFGASHPNPPRLYANRGASGIDGIVSTACGVSKALQKKGVLLTGDLTFLYDTNGLSLLKSLDNPLVTVVVNNQGGGIFTMLDIHRQKEIFTPYFDAEHDVDLSGLCAAYKINFLRVAEMGEWLETLERIVQTGEHLVVEVVSDKWRNKEEHDRVREALRARFNL